jgi:hypothetical protein
MGKISRNQKDYIKAYEKLNEEGINVSGLIMLTEMSYEGKENLSEYKLDSRFKSEHYCSEIDIYFRHMLSTYFKIDGASSIYNNYQDIFNQIYLDNTDDDTNDYKDETMIKLNKISNFINNIEDENLEGTKLLSLIRKEINNEEGSLEDPYFDIIFSELRRESEEIKITDSESKMGLIPKFLDKIGDMEAHLFEMRLFKEDYRKSVTGLINYLFIRAELPEIYIKPIELDEYYSCVTDKTVDENRPIVTFLQEKICDSIEDVLIVPMKNTIKYYLDNQIRKESGDLDNKIVTLRQNKYK